MDLWIWAIVRNEMLKMLLCCQRLMVDTSLIHCISLIARKKKKKEGERERKGQGKPPYRWCGFNWYQIRKNRKEWNELLIFIFLHFVAAHRRPSETVAYTTVKHSIPAEQEELIHLQKQVKKGVISVDEALDKFKRWQNENQRPQYTLQVWIWTFRFLDGNLDQFGKQSYEFWLLCVRSKTGVVISGVMSDMPISSLGSCCLWFWILEIAVSTIIWLFERLPGVILPKCRCCCIWLKSRVKSVLLRLLFYAVKWCVGLCIFYETTNFL